MSSADIDTGAIVHDREGDDPSDAVVINTPPKTCAEWYVPGRGTVAADNPAYPPDDPVVVVLYCDDLQAHWPYYIGVGPLPLADVIEAGVKPYAFPASRLSVVGQRDRPKVPLAAILPSRYHARSFTAEQNREFIAEIRERGHPEPPPLVRVVDGGDRFRLVNGHKRTWAAAVAGLNRIPVLPMYVDDETAARAWANRHLDGYDSRQRERALERLRDRWGDRTAELVGRGSA